MPSAITGFESAAGSPADKVAAFAEAAQKHRAKLMLLAWRVTSRREEAEDIVQDALLKAFRALPRFRGDSRMDTWLYTIVRNAALEYLRHRKGRIELPLEPFRPEDDDIVAYEFPDPGKTPEEYCERTELRSLLHSAMRDLTSRSRLAIQMCIFQELPCRLVASGLDVSVATVKTRVFHGKRMLKRAVYRRTHPAKDSTGDLHRQA